MKFLNHSKVEKSTLQDNPDQITLEVETNDLPSNKDAEQTAEAIIDVASSLNSDAINIARK